MEAKRSVLTRGGRAAERRALRSQPLFPPPPSRFAHPPSFSCRFMVPVQTLCSSSDGSRQLPWPCGTTGLVLSPTALLMAWHHVSPAFLFLPPPSLPCLLGVVE